MKILHFLLIVLVSFFLSGFDDNNLNKLSESQNGSIYPDYNTSPVAPDSTGMKSNAVELAKKIRTGINIGNTLEATGGETSWHNPKITGEFISLIKESGFNAVRIPCSWNQYADGSTALIKPEWLERVKEVVQYCVDNDLYVVLNIHWDGGWLERHCTPADQKEVNARQKAFWEQIATKMRDFDEHLLFASANEPDVSDATGMSVLMTYHQTFINAVRSTGGRNAYRNLVIQGPSTDIEKTNKLMTSMPSDPVANRLMMEIHYYTPWNFAGLTRDESWGKRFFYWGKDNHSATDPDHNPTWGEEPTVDSFFKLMKGQFVDKGIPVIVGEFGAILRRSLPEDLMELHKASRVYYFGHITQQARVNGLLPFFWDTGGAGSVFDRINNQITDNKTLEALIQ